MNQNEKECHFWRIDNIGVDIEEIERFTKLDFKVNENFFNNLFTKH